MRGAEVALLERTSSPKGRPGETLHPGVEVIFERLGVASDVGTAGWIRHLGHWVSWAGPPRFEAFGQDTNGPWRGFQAPRRTLDAILLARARALGVDVQQGCKHVEPVIEHERVVGVATSSTTIRAKVTVDAGGGAHWLGRRLSLTIERFSPRLIASYGYALGERLERDTAPLLCARGSEWTWIAYVGERRYHWTRLPLESPADSAGKRLGRPARLAAMAELGAPRHEDVSWRIVSASAGNGYFIVGDAAAVLDPCASHGVLRALMTGIMAAHLAVRTMQSPCLEEQLVEYYRKWVSGWFHHDRRRLEELYRCLKPHPSWLD